MGSLDIFVKFALAPTLPFVSFMLTYVFWRSLNFIRSVLFVCHEVFDLAFTHG